MISVMPSPKPLRRPSGPKIKRAAVAITMMRIVVMTSTKRKKYIASASDVTFKIEFVESLIKTNPMITPEKLKAVSA